MKNNHRRLAALLRMVDANFFFSITIQRDDIQLLAHSSSKIVKAITTAKFEFDEIVEGLIIFKRGNISIYLA